MRRRIRAHTDGIRMRRKVYLDSFQFALFRVELPPPNLFDLRVLLHTGLELVDLLPSRIELLAHVIQFLCVSTLCLFNTPVKLQLNLA